ncbi:MAG: family 43 glycosylhydrolase [Opitutales bacterium]
MKPVHEELSPTLPGFFPDPSICCAGEDYFLTTSSFEYFPGLPLFHSRDLQHWTPIGHILNRPSQLPLRDAWISGGIYAPTLRYRDGTFYCITTNTAAPHETHRRNFFVTTENPCGDWSEPVWIDGMPGIDPDLFWDSDNTCYAQWSWKQPGQPAEEICIAQAAIDLKTGKLLEAPRTLWNGTGGLGPEGPHLYLKDGVYYLCIAEGGTEYGHMQTLARSRSVRGPFEPCPHNPVLTHRSLPTAVHAVGHCDLVEGANGQWLGVCHGIRPQGYHHFHVLGRETFLFPVQWKEDGWPVFGDDGKLPAHALGPPIETTFEDTFETEDWPLEWNALRETHAGDFQRSGDGCLRFSGGAPLHCFGERVTWRGTRQRDHSFRLEIDLEPIDPGDGGGLTVFQNPSYHACLGIRRADHTMEGFTRLQLGELILEDAFPLVAAQAQPSNPPLSLIVEAEPLAYHFIIRVASVEKRVRTFDARLMSTEFGGRFTGVYLALFAEGASTFACTRLRYGPR